jgi:predicted alpha/beta hydrolase
MKNHGIGKGKENAARRKRKRYKDWSSFMLPVILTTMKCDFVFLAY